MSGAMWFLVVVVVSVVVSGSVGVILNFFLGDSKENVSEGGVVSGVKTSRDEKDGKGKGAVIFDGGVVSAEYFRGYLDGHRDGSGRNDDALGMVALQQRCRDGYYAR
nr:MAG TPA: hypothetical protein [Caudoviricetes sp.]